jgi:hypothetical protein
MARPATANEPSAAPASSQAQAATSRAPDPDARRFNVGGYGWPVSITGNSTTRGQTVDTNASFIDLLQKSEPISREEWLCQIPAHRLAAS